jgi:DNA-binding PadR family transcriptional regulator
VLGLLIERRGYGYELVQRLSERLGEAWRLNPSAVYSALDRLEQEGLIEAVSAGQVAALSQSARPTRRAARVVYRASEHGTREFEEWLARPSACLEPIRPQLAMKVALLSPDGVPALLAAIAHEEALIKRSLSKQSHATKHVQSWSAAAAVLTSAAAMTRLRAELAWLGWVRETVERLLADELGASAPAGQPASAAIEVSV